MAIPSPFSSRHRYASAKEITIREDAPKGLRFAVIETAQQLGFAPSDLRGIVCRVLRVMPDRNNWSEYPNIWDEVMRQIERCDWYKVYDVIEGLYAAMLAHDNRRGDERAPQFEELVNHMFMEDGIGWQLADGQIVTRGEQSFEAIVAEAQTRLQASDRPTAAKHIKDALDCMSRRPEPNTSGAVYHAMGSLECVARDVTGDLKATLGDILKRHPGLLPKPLDTALSQVWGYASNEARHVQEGKEISYAEAELLVGLSATVCTYLSGKADI